MENPNKSFYNHNSKFSFLNFIHKKINNYSGGRLLLRFLKIPLNYLKEIRWEDDEKFGISLVQQFWNSGFLGRIALILIIIALALTVFFINTPEKIKADSTSIIGMFGIAVAFSFLIVSGTHQSTWLYLIISAYICWFLLPIGINLAGTWKTALPVLWLLFLGLLNSTIKLQNQIINWGFLILCFGAGQLLYRPFGLDRVVPDQLSSVARILLGMIIYICLSTNVMKRISIKANRFLEKKLLIFFISLLTFGMYLLFACLNDYYSTIENLLLNLKGALGLVDLFWFWLGWTVFVGIIDITDFGFRQIEKNFSTKFIRIISPILWGISLVFCWLSTRNSPITILILLKKIGFLDWIYSWSDPFYFTVYDFLWFNLLIFGIYIVFLIKHKLDLKIVKLLNIIWASAFFCLLSYYQSMNGMVSLDLTSMKSLTRWTSFLLIGGIFWEFAKSGASNWEFNSKTKVHAFSAVFLLLLSITSVTLGANLPDLINEYTLYSFLGVVYLGFPLAILDLYPQFFNDELIEGKYLLAFFLVGCASAIICLVINPFTGWHIFLVPFIWRLALIIVEKKIFMAETKIQNFLVGSAISLGFITFWFSPEYIPIPFITIINNLQLSYLMVPLSRPFLLPQQFQITIVVVLIGSFHCLLWSRTSNRIHRGITLFLTCIILPIAFFLILPN